MLKQEKLLEGLSNCRALEGIIRDSFTSIKVRTSTSTQAPADTREISSENTVVQAKTRCA